MAVQRHRQERGASAVEYGLLLAGICGLIIAAMFLFGDATSGLVNGSCESIVQQMTGAGC